jgi:hypothetical protein
MKNEEIKNVLIIPSSFPAIWHAIKRQQVTGNHSVL